MSFGAWLRQRRMTLDLTQWELAERVGCSRDTIQKIEAGTRRPSKQVAELLAACLGIPPAERAAFVSWARVDAAGFPPEVLSLPASPPSPRPGPISSSEPPAVNHLPAPLTSLVGRAQAIEEVRRYLLRDDVRLLTLVGPPGIGKTRLGIAAAGSTVASASVALKDGAYFVALESKDDPSLVAGAIAESLGVKPVGNEPMLAAVSRYLRHRSTLLVLDNFEQVLDAGPQLIELLGACPSLKILVTSREALHIYGEWRFPVPPLELPDCNRLPNLEVLGRVASVALFTQRAQAVEPDFRLTSANAWAVASICTRLQGLPLAIELAATRVGLLSLDDILAGLRSRLQLKSNLRNLPPRQRTLRGAIDWSYHLLQPSERALFRRVGIFAGGCTLAAANAICGAQDSPSTNSELGADSPVQEGLVSLVDKSLLHYSSGERRYGMLEMLREYALERLRASAEEPEMRRRHAEYYLGVAEAAAPQLTGPDQAEWLRKLEAENANLRAALAWSVEAGPETAVIALRLTGALARFWSMHGYLSEGRRWLELALEQAAASDAARVDGAEKIPLDIHIKVLSAAGGLAYFQSDFATARSFCERELRLAKEMGNKLRIAKTLGNLGNVANHLGEYAEAQVLHAQALALCRELGDKTETALRLLNMGVNASCMGDHASAQSLYQESLGLCRELGNQLGIALALSNLGQVAIFQGNWTSAGPCLDESRALFKDLGDERRVGFCLKELARRAYAQHDYGPARALAREGLALCYKVGDEEGVAECLERLAEAEVNIGPRERGVQLWGAADAIRQTLSAPIPPGWRCGFDQAIAQARTESGETAFAAAWAEGRAMTLEQAMAFAQGIGDEEQASVTVLADPHH